MKALKNITIGFLVSFIGSIPLGYLNIIGFQVKTDLGCESLIYYLLGVVFIEAFVIYFTLVFADKLAHKKRLLKAIEVFSIFFMLFLAAVFYFQSAEKATGNISRYGDYSPFVIGIIFSSLNFLQVPFWMGWNLFLLNADYVSAEPKLRFVFVAGTLIGTFCGMLAFVEFLGLVTENSGSLGGYVLSHLIPLFFVGVACFQAFKFYKKYYAETETGK